MFLGLRMTDGISRTSFYETFGKFPEEVYESVFRKYEKLGMLKREGDRIFLTRPGISVSNVILADFLLDSE